MEAFWEFPRASWGHLGSFCGSFVLWAASEADWAAFPGRLSLGVLLGLLAGFVDRSDGRCGALFGSFGVPSGVSWAVLGPGVILEAVMDL